MSTILIVGGGLQAVSTARSLKEAGYKVALWYVKKDYANKSSALSAAHTGNLINDLDCFIKENKISVVIPMSGNMAIQLSSRKKDIEETTGAKVAVPDYNVLKTASDKLELMELCRINNLPHPRTLASTDISEETIKELQFPVLIKPNHSVGARGISKIESPAQLSSSLARTESVYGACHIQEYIQGNLPYYNVMIYRNKEGKCIAHTILKIIRYYPIQGGSSSMCETIESPELLQLCMTVLDKLNYIGFADFDVLQDENGEYKIIEINPRVPASLRGAAISGINFPAIICADILGEEIPKQEYQPGKTLRYLGLDLMWFLVSPNRFSSKPSWFNFFGKNIYYQEGGWKDLKPMIYSLISNFNKLEFRNGKLRKKSV